MENEGWRTMIETRFTQQWKECCDVFFLILIATSLLNIYCTLSLQTLNQPITPIGGPKSISIVAEKDRSFFCKIAAGWIEGWSVVFKFDNQSKKNEKNTIKNINIRIENNKMIQTVNTLKTIILPTSVCPPRIIQMWANIFDSKY